MPRLSETFETRLPIERAFAFVADFSNAQHWDPGVAWSHKLDEVSPRVGARYQLGVRMGPRVASMEYRISHLEPDRRVVLDGTGPGVVAVDDISFQATPRGTRIEYVAQIDLHGWLRLAQPFTGRAFAAIARNAREGMLRTLDELADGDSQPVEEQAA